MPRFYFDTDDGQTTVKDVYGIELDDEHAARNIAVKALPDLAQQARPEEDTQKMAVHVRNESDEAILDATISLVVDWKSDVAN